MKLEQRIKTTANPKKRLGQGYGSGKGGHTVGKGQKGQRSRGTIPHWFEGGQLPQIRRFPFIRGKSRFKSLLPEVVTINLAQLSKFQPNTVVDLKQLVDAGLISVKDLKTKRVKVVATGSINVPLTVTLSVSQAAQQKIEAAGGQVNREQAE